jgi:hypothetical protein
MSHAHNNTSTKIKLLASVAALPLVLGALAGAANIAAAANGITAAGGAVPTNLPGSLWYTDIFNNAIVVTADTPLTAAVAPIWIIADGPITVNATTSITSTGNHGIYLDSGDFTHHDALIINSSGAVSGGLSGIVSQDIYGASTTDGQGTGTVTATTGHGIWDYTYGAQVGDITIKNFADITANGLSGIFVADAGTGNVIIDNNTNIKGAVDGIYVDAYANGGTNEITVTNNGPITGTATIGLDLSAWNGDITVQNNGAITGGAGALLTSTINGDTLIDNNGLIHATAGHGIVSTSAAGDQTVTNNNGITADAGTAVWLTSITGAETVNNNKDIKGSLYGIYAATSTNDINIQGNGAITGTTNAGIFAANNLGGDINVGNTAINTGVISGGVDGIWVANMFSGDNNVTTINDVSGTAWGELSTTVNGNNTVKVNGGTITGNAALEVTTVGSGNVDTTIASGAVVNGTTWGYVTTTTATGTGLTKNSGTIRTVADNGLSGDTGLVATVWVKGGTANTIDNLAPGKIFGGFTDAGLNTVFNNAGLWDAALLNAMNSTSQINNTGVINIRTGSTVGVGVTNNQSGGLVDMTYGGTSPNATDTLYTYDFNAAAGSMTNFNVDFTLANGSGVNDAGDDHSSNGLGTADTIRSVANPTPGAGAIINLVNVGGPAVGTSGSVALILPDVNSAGMIDPGLGGLATLIPSANYIYGTGDPSTGAVKVVLQEDAFGGLYLRWAPNVTAATLGGFFGGPLSGGGASANASRIGNSSGPVAALGGGLSGGPSGGGVAGGVADSAAGSAGNSQNCVVSKDSMSDGYSNANHAWLSGTGSRSSFTGGGTGWDVGTAVGIEHDLGGAAGIGCGNLAIGVFGDFGGFGSSSAASKIDGTAKGGGVYAKAASQSGFYASVLAGVNWNDANLTNGALNSTAKQSSRSTLVTASVGVTHDVTDSIALDARAFGSIAHTNGDGFTDSSGFAVTGTSTDITSYGFLLGLNADVTSNTTAFVRGGVKWLNVDQSATAYGTTVSGQSDAFVKSLEAGFTSQLSDSAVLSGSAFGDWTTGSNSYGGNLSIAFKL